MSLTTIIVTYNAESWIHKCLGSLIESTLKGDVIVIDNGSKDKTLEIIKEKYSDVELIESNENLGFAKANNIGIKKAYQSGSDYVFLLNQDAWVEPNTLDELVRVHQENKDYGVLSPIHLNGEGDRLDWNFTNYISNPSNQGRNLYTDLLKNKPLKKVYNIDFVNAAGWLISRECIEKVGVFDDVLFPHYGEDDNYIQRVIFYNFKIGVVPNIFIYHDREERFGKSVKTIFSVDKKLMRFKCRGANILEENAVSQLEKELKSDRRHLLKLIFTFKVSNFLSYKLLYTKKMELLDLIILQRKSYGK